MFMGYIGHYQVLTSCLCREMVQAKTHRKRRINKKWLKKYGTKWVPRKDIFVLSDPPRLIMHPATYKKLVVHDSEMRINIKVPTEEVWREGDFIIH